MMGYVLFFEDLKIRVYEYSILENRRLNYEIIPESNKIEYSNLQLHEYPNYFRLKIKYSNPQILKYSV